MPDTCRKAEIENLCAAVISGMRKFYKDESNLARFEEWKKQKEEKHD